MFELLAKNHPNMLPHQESMYSKLCTSRGTSSGQRRHKLALSVRSRTARLSRFKREGSSADGNDLHCTHRNSCDRFEKSSPTTVQPSSTSKCSSSTLANCSALGISVPWLSIADRLIPRSLSVPCPQQQNGQIHRNGNFRAPKALETKTSKTGTFKCLE